MKIKTDLTRMKGHLAILLFGIILSVSFLAIISISDSNLCGAAIKFEDPNAGVILHGLYYPGESQYGILLCHGFGSDQVAMKPLASEFCKEGFHVFTFDFMGHGRSEGVIQFNNAETDVLAKEVLIALDVFKNRSGIPEHRIFIIGHSMGARVSLQSQTMTNQNVLGLVLFGASINLQTNVQSDFFTGVQDSTLQWIQNLNSTNPKTDLCIISGTNDDILNPNAASALLNKLNEGIIYPYKRDLILVDGVFHNYEIWTPASIQSAKQWIKNQLLLVNASFSEQMESSVQLTQIRISSWICTTIGLFITIISASSFLKSKKRDANGSQINEGSKNHQMKITETKKWVKYKLLSWLPALAIGLIIMMVLFIIPIGIPVFNIVFVGLITGYGLWMVWMLKRKRLPFSDNQYDFKSLLMPQPFDKQGLLPTSLLIVYIIAICSWLASTGLYTVFPILTRGFWLVLFAGLSGFGYYIGQKEFDWAKTYKVHSQKLIAISLIPFVIFLVFFLAIGSLSGMLGMFQNLIILALVAFIGDLLNTLSKNGLLSALFQGLLLQLLIIPQGALFPSFI